MVAGLIEMVVESVRVHTLSTQHVVILRETGRDRYLPIWIGPWEANAIALKLQGVSPERPLTHDLFARTLSALGVAIVRIVVSDLADETFRARIVLDHGGRAHEIDARPSDAIALAIRAGAPIFATHDVLDRAGVIPETDEQERLSVFRQFVNSLDVELEGPGGPPPDERGRGPGSQPPPRPGR